MGQDLGIPNGMRTISGRSHQRYEQSVFTEGRAVNAVIVDAHLAAIALYAHVFLVYVFIVM